MFRVDPLSVLVAASLLSACRPLKIHTQPITPRPFHANPFVVMLNAFDTCYIKKITWDYSQYYTVSDYKKTNQVITLLYEHSLGEYPYVDVYPNNRSYIKKVHYAAIPQKTDMGAHLKKAKEDLLKWCPENIPGIGVIDWEKWRPRWVRNGWTPDMKHYQRLSREYVRERFPDMSEKDVGVKAKAELEEAAKKMFLETLRVAKNTRDKRLWGFYLFPDCYNHYYDQPHRKPYPWDGKCPSSEITRNNLLQWLWKEVTVLFPSIYLTRGIRPNYTYQTIFTRNRVGEALRIGKFNNPKYSIPIYTYSSFYYMHEKKFLDLYPLESLVTTIGEAASLGTAGIIMWTNTRLSATEDTCTQTKDFMSNLLNPYILNVTTAARHCSRAICMSKGRCVRKNPVDAVYLHLNPQHFKIERNTSGKLYVKGRLRQEDVVWYNQTFDCMCYTKEPCQRALKIVQKPKEVLETEREEIDEGVDNVTDDQYEEEAQEGGISPQMLAKVTMPGVGIVVLLIVLILLYFRFRRRKVAAVHIVPVPDSSPPPEY